LEFSFLRWDVFFAVTTFLDVDGEAVWVKPSVLVRGRESVDTTGPSSLPRGRLTQKKIRFTENLLHQVRRYLVLILYHCEIVWIAILDQPSDDARQHRHAEQQDNEEENGSAGSTWLVKSSSWYPSQ
jgi:hypothetical protein